MWSSQARAAFGLLVALLCCQPAAGSVLVQWSKPLQVPGQTFLSQHDIYRCAVLNPAAAEPGSSVTHLGLQVDAHGSTEAAAGARLRQALLLDCDASLWQLSSIEASEEACIASTATLRAACNQWLLTVPAPGQQHSETSAPPSTAFATPDSLQGRLLVLQTHWQLPGAADRTEAVSLPSLQLTLGTGSTSAGAAAEAAAAAAAGQASGAAGETAAAAAAGANGAAGEAAAPALLGTFAGAGIYPPSQLSGALQAFQVPVPVAAAAGNASTNSSLTATASLACSKRCTYVPLGKLLPKPVTVVGYSFSTFDRATAVSFKVQRGKWGWAAGAQAVQVAAAPGQGYVPLQQPFKLHAGDVVRWRCTYNMSSIAAGTTLHGGYNSSLAAQQEQCTVMLHYWPRVEAMRGCTAALDSDALLGENMCSSEAEDLLRIKAEEDQQFPMRRAYQERSFPAAAWMGGWKATHLVLQMAVVWACLWGFQALLGSCKALGPIHKRFVSLHAAQRRNVSLYLTHLVLDTAALAYVSQPMLELWFGLTETVAEVRAGSWGFTYIVACYALELTWRCSIDTMLAIHHVGTITIILLYAGELTPYTYRVANNLIVLAAFALMEQPTYVALLLKRMLPSHSKHAVRAARVGYISWFVLKGLSVLLAVSMFAEDWHLMPVWMRINFAITWVVAAVVQGWSGFIQRGIYRQILQAHKRSQWEHTQAKLKRKAAAALWAQQHETSSSEDDTDGGSSTPRGIPETQSRRVPLLAARGVASSSGGGSDPARNSSAGGLIAAGRPSLQLSASGRSGLSSSDAGSDDSRSTCRVDSRRVSGSGFLALCQAGCSSSSGEEVLAPLLRGQRSLPLSLEQSAVGAGATCEEL